MKSIWLLTPTAEPQTQPRDFRTRLSLQLGVPSSGCQLLTSCQRPKGIAQALQLQREMPAQGSVGRPRLLPAFSWGSEVLLGCGGRSREGLVGNPKSTKRGCKLSGGRKPRAKAAECAAEASGRLIKQRQRCQLGPWPGPAGNEAPAATGVLPREPTAQIPAGCSALKPLEEAVSIRTSLEELGPDLLHSPWQGGGWNCITFKAPSNPFHQFLNLQKAAPKTQASSRCWHWSSVPGFGTSPPAVTDLQLCSSLPARDNSLQESCCRREAQLKWKEGRKKLRAFTAPS